MPEEKNLSPEEKLLNVIQGKDKPAPPATADAKAAKPQAPAQAAPAPVPVGQPGDKSKPLSLAQPAPTPRPAVSPTPAVAQAAPAAKTTMPPAGSGQTPAAPRPAGKNVDDDAKAPKKTAQPARANLKAPSASRLDVRSRTLATVNRLLRVGIVAMVGLCGWEIWASCSTVPVPAKTVVGRNTKGATGPVAPAEPCSALLASFAGKSLFTPVVVEPVEPTVTNIEKKTTISEVQQYVTRNLNLIGVSPGPGGTIQEAILTDMQTKRNYFLKVGDKITMKNWAIELKKIAADHAVFQCGKEEIQVQ